MIETRNNYSDIVEVVGQRFWRHIHKETLVPYSTNRQKRNLFLRNLESKLSNMQYVPSPPREYVVSHKQNLVVRFIPLLTKADYCVYFYIIKKIEDEIARNRVKGTYGGWKLGGKIRKMENTDEALSMSDYSYNRFEWIKAWTDYQKKAYRFFRNKKYKYFVVFDIANFYDSIRLDRLELLLREAIGKRKTPYVNLLLYFLTNWGKRDQNYEIQSIGLPQDEVGDCSRILANFYLQDYDQKINELSISKNAGYLRYADDQIIAAKDEATAKEIMFLASKELTKLGLNLNAAKAKLFNSRDDFNTYWSFDIFKKLNNPNDSNNVEEGFKLYKERVNSKFSFKPDTIIKRLLSCNLSKINEVTKNEILEIAMQSDFLINLNEYYLKRIYVLLDKKQKKIFLSKLEKLSSTILFNQFHLRIIKFGKENHINKLYISKIKQNLNKLQQL